MYMIKTTISIALAIIFMGLATNMLDPTVGGLAFWSGVLVLIGPLRLLKVFGRVLRMFAFFL